MLDLVGIAAVKDLAPGIPCRMGLLDTTPAFHFSLIHSHMEFFIPFIPRESSLGPS